MKQINRITYDVIGCSFRIHKELGPGLLESTYEVCLTYELAKMGYAIQQQAPLPVIYDNIRLENSYRIDLWVEKQVIVELKSTDYILPVHKAQLLTYLKLSGTKVGLLINFNVDDLKKGIIRMIL